MIPSPSSSVKIEVYRQNIAGHFQQTFENKKFLDITLQCFALLPQVNIPAHNLNFHWRWWDRIHAIFLNLFYFTLRSKEIRALKMFWNNSRAYILHFSKISQWSQTKLDGPNECYIRIFDLKSTKGGFRKNALHTSHTQWVKIVSKCIQ